MCRDIVYINMSQSTVSNKRDVCVSDVASIYCSNDNVVNKVKSIKAITFANEKKCRYILSAMYIIKLITEKIPGIQVENIGEVQCLVEYKEKNKGNEKAWEYAKVVFICITIFFGAAFAIMTFNTDVNTKDLFHNLYYQFTGEKSDGCTVIEVMYSVGLAIGIIVFYNHFGSKKLSKDPTPIEVEMRKYETDINTTLIDGVKRKEMHKDVN